VPQNDVEMLRTP